MYHLNHLNFQQKEAVSHTDGPLLIVAGAGAGKTKTITSRIAHLISEGVAPNKILAVTFTNKAAREMKERVLELLGQAPGSYDMPVPFMGTFHALGAYMLRHNANRAGRTRHFSIVDKQDALSLLKEAMKEAGIDPKETEPRKIQNTISRQKGELITAAHYARDAGNEFFPQLVADVWRRYETLLAKHNAVDFDDLLSIPVHLLREHSDMRTAWQGKWSHIHIDEYQDTNGAQYEMARILTEPERNICVVGDADQNIYSWRGADIQNLLDFETQYPNAKVVLLEENYRSTQTILTAANQVIAKNTIRKEKNLFTKNEDGEQIAVLEGFDEADEAAQVAKTTTELIQDGAAPSDIAILYRANFQSRALEEAMLAAEIPYQVLGTRFFDRKEVKDVISFLKAGLNPDSLPDVKRIINVPPRGIGKTTLIKMFAGQVDSLPTRLQGKVADFKNMLARIGAEAGKRSVPELLKFIIAETGLEQSLRGGTEEDQERLENIRELVTLAQKYAGLTPEEGVEKFLEDAALATDQDNLERTHNSVKLMTVHAAKGLEFPYVFVTGMEQDLFPHAGKEDSEDRERQEEERRLFYVAVTRAERKLFLAHAATRTIFGAKQVCVPSEFLTDIDDDLLASKDRGDELLTTIYL